jgi:hypothetical protein
VIDAFMLSCRLPFALMHPHDAGRVAVGAAAWLFRLSLRGVVAAWLVSTPAAAQADWLRDSWAEVIAATPFEEPVHVASEARSHSVSGSVHARVHHPFETLIAELRSPEAWCEILFLHFNVKACLYEEGAESRDAALELYVGRQHYQPLVQAERLDLQLRITATEPRYLDVSLEGDQGPYGTRAFRLRLRAVPYDDSQSLIQLRYSLVLGTAARIAMRSYFTFGGRHREGFTVEGHGADGEPHYVGGVRGMIERNVMWFYLALETHLDTRALAEDERLLARLRRWFALTERYPRQLLELDRQTYLEQKQREYARQQALVAP